MDFEDGEFLRLQGLRHHNLTKEVFVWPQAI